MRHNKLISFFRHNELLLEKIKESLSSVLPITAIVLAISVTIAPLTPGTMVLFLFGALLLVFGMGLFSLGVLKTNEIYREVYESQVKGGTENE